MQLFTGETVRYIREALSATGQPQSAAFILRVLAAIFGGYALTYSALAALVLLLPLAPIEVVFVSPLFPGLIHLGALLWAFAAPTAWRAWQDIFVMTAVCSFCALAAWLK
ncbi:MAG: hypothetical protein H6Q72_1931 [Firmicutes bacterium]|nr:hypothetical protein [Bacillota bacterium]